jgi:hypothetical protein
VALIALKLYGHVPTGSIRDPPYTTPVTVEPEAAMSLHVPFTRRRTHVGAAPVVSETVT